MSLLFILLHLLISSDIHFNPSPIDHCSVCTYHVTWGNRSVQCANCSLRVRRFCSGLSLFELRKFFPEHSWTCPKCSFPSQTSSLFSSSKKSTPKNHSTSFTITNSSNLSKLTSTYPPSASSLPFPQPQPSILPLTQTTFHHSFSSQNCI